MSWPICRQWPTKCTVLATSWVLPYKDVCHVLREQERFSAPKKMLTVWRDMTRCLKECLMPLEIDNLSSFICKMSACQVVSKRQTTKDTAAHVSSLPATELQMQCGRADSPSPCGILNHLRALNSHSLTAMWALAANTWLRNFHSWQLTLSELLIPKQGEGGLFQLLRLSWFIYVTTAFNFCLVPSHICNFETETGGHGFKTQKIIK